jgi:hypothetical protein
MSRADVIWQEASPKLFVGMHLGDVIAVANQRAMLVCPLENGTIETLDSSETRRPQARGQFGSAITDGVIENDLSVRGRIGQGDVIGTAPGRYALPSQDDSRSIPLVCEHREAQAADDVDLPANPPVHAS